MLATIPGIGIMGASAIAATVTDPSLFRSGREFAAWLGMTPRQNSSGGKERLGRTSKRGDKYIRCLLVAGAVAVLRARAHADDTRTAAWVRGLLARKPTKVVAVALANKNARIAWAVMARGEAYRSKPVIGQDGISRRRACTECEGEEEVMASGRAADRENPDNSRRNPARILDRDPIRELHQGQRSHAPHRQAGHMTAPDFDDFAGLAVEGEMAVRIASDGSITAAFPVIELHHFVFGDQEKRSRNWSPTMASMAVSCCRMTVGSHRGYTSRGRACCLFRSTVALSRLESYGRCLAVLLLRFSGFGATSQIRDAISCQSTLF